MLYPIRQAAHKFRNLLNRIVEITAMIRVTEVDHLILSGVESLRPIGVIVPRMEAMILMVQLMSVVGMIKTDEVGEEVAEMIIDNDLLLQVEMRVTNHL